MMMTIIKSVSFFFINNNNTSPVLDFLINNLKYYFCLERQTPKNKNIFFIRKYSKNLMHL